MKTKATRTGFLAVLILAGHAFAGAGQDVRALDTNDDGVLTIIEVRAEWPHITAQTFSAIDLNADGVLDAQELEPAQEAGLLPPRSGGA